MIADILQHLTGAGSSHRTSGKRRRKLKQVWNHREVFYTPTSHRCCLQKCTHPSVFVMNSELTILIDSWRAVSCDAGELDRVLRDVVRSGTFVIGVAIESGESQMLHLPRESNAFVKWRALQYQPPLFVYERGGDDLYGGRREGFCRCWLNIRRCRTESWN